MVLLVKIDQMRVMKKFAYTLWCLIYFINKAPFLELFSETSKNIENGKSK
ncbi:MAG: hypothetical protein ACI88L_000184 [Candidatus Paceibacteria bacterium]|jgi:hypothetical protein